MKEKTRDITTRLPEGYFTEIAGQYQNMTETFTTLAFALLLSLILVFSVMASLYENLKFPFINMFTLPLAFIGGLLASTVLNLFFIPVLYTYFAKIKTGSK